MDSSNNTVGTLSRRRFIEGTMASFTAMAAAGTVVGAADEKKAEEKKPQEYSRKIKLGLVGGGGRGTWIAGFFKKHGGYTIHALADYFENVANQSGEALGVDKARRFSGLSGYKKLIESGVDAVAIEDVPCFYPEQAKAAVDAGLHVYIAKPLSVDVPGTLLIAETGKRATEKKLCFLVDYQLPTDPAMIEICKRVGDGALGQIVHIMSFGFGWHAWPDPPIGPNIESRLRDQIWLSDTGLSGDTIVSYDIHIIDGLMAVLGRRPVSASGRSLTCRPKPNGDRTDAAAVVYEFEDGAPWTHVTQALDNQFDVTTLSAKIFGMKATAHIQYAGKVYVRGGDKHYVGNVGNVFNEGVERNIASFYTNITENHFENPTVQRAVDGHLTAILGREAAARRKYLTMDELVKENKKLVVNLEGLKT